MIFPNLPYISDGNFKLSETIAIARYVVNQSDKKELLGKDLKDQAMVDNITGVYRDIIDPLFQLFNDENFEETKLKTLEKIKPKLDLLNKFYGEK